jgi:hypothetical protein
VDINDNPLFPNANGSPIFPGTKFTGPILAGNIFHSDGSGTLAGLGETASGTANVGYAVMGQTAAGVTQSATAVLTPIVIPAQSQLTEIRVMVTTAATGSQVGAFLFGASGTSLTPALSVATGTTGTVLVGSAGGGTTPAVAGTSAVAAVWDNIGNQDQQLAFICPANGNGVFTITAFYLQGINNQS